MLSKYNILSQRERLKMDIATMEALGLLISWALGILMGLGLAYFLPLKNYLL